MVGLATALSWLALAHAAWAHEMWLSPQSYQIEADGNIVIDIRIGENFKGSAYRYIPNGFVRFDIARNGDIRPVDSTVGDTPAVNETAGHDGLVIGLHVSTVQTVTYVTMEKFKNFTRHKGYSGAADTHRARNLPEDRFREAYTRFAKTLISAGSGSGADRAFGLETEIVALENPYTGDMTDGIDLKVLYGAEPRSKAQVEIFEKPVGDDAVESDVNIFFLETEPDGTVNIPVKPGHEYLVDAVVLREPSEALAAERNVVWESLWASLTFAVAN